MSSDTLRRIRYTTGNPEVLELVNLIDELNERIKKLEERVLWIETYAEGVR